MPKRTVGALVFVAASVALWSLTIYLSLASPAAGAPYVRAAGFVALILTLHTVLYVLFSGRKSRRRDYFLQHGKPLETRIATIKRRGPRTAWRVTSTYVDRRTGREVVFKSDILRRNPSRRLQIGDTVMVYLHPTKADQYWMETGIEGEYL